MRKVKKEDILATKFFMEENEKGLSKTKVAKLFGSDRHTILKLQNIYSDFFESADEADSEYMFYFYQDEKEAIKYYNEHPNCSKIEIMKKFNIGRTTTLDNWLRICGFSSERHYRYHYNRKFFQQEPNEIMCYWLGFLLADGCVTGSHNRYYIIQLRVGEKDKEHIWKLAEHLGYSLEEANQAINTTIGGSYARDNICYSLDICSTSMVKDVEKYNIVPKKSMKEKPYIFETEELQLAYIRGIIDGDGWISSPTNKNKRMGVCGSKEVCSYIRDFLSQYTNEYVSPIYVKQKNNKAGENIVLYGWNMSNHKGTSDILKKLYPKNAKVYLTRKYNNAWAVIKSLN